MRYPVQVVLLHMLASRRCLIYSYKWARTKASIPVLNELVIVASGNVLAIKVLQQIFGVDSSVVALRDKRVAHFRISGAILVIGRRRLGFLVGEVRCGGLRLRREKIRLQILHFVRFLIVRAW